uniref:Uncharacterized protein n=1 Tax=Anguilla anguilla TaxID=7936 RepID=A0A0E9TV54_ANGAN
MDSLNQTIPQS